jgi:hypothetical protein
MAFSLVALGRKWLMNSTRPLNILFSNFIFISMCLSSTKIIYAASNGACSPTYGPIGGESITCDSGTTPLATGGINSQANSTSAGNGVSVTINAGMNYDINGSTIGLGSRARINNSGILNTNSFSNGYGISTGTNGRSQAGGNVINNLASGQIRTAGFNADGIFVSATSAGSAGNTITNAGSITTSGISAYGIRLNSGATVATITNTIFNSGSITTTNSSASGILLRAAGGIATITNSGTISTSGSMAHGIQLSSGAGLVSIENTGVITASAPNAFGIANNGMITTLINSQGGSTPLTYSGALPDNYSIIVTSPSNYGKLDASNTTVSGVMSFGINSASTLSYNTIYSGVFNDISINNIENTYGRITLGSAYTWALAKRLGTEQIDLIVEPSDVVTTDVEQLQAILVDQGYALVPEDSDTEASLVSLGGALQGLFASQSVGLINGMSYDCTVFGPNNICVSTGGRFTNVSSDQFNTTSALIIGAYRFTPQIRFGAYLDQNLSSSTPGGIAQLSNANPMAGLFAVWSQKLDGTGLEAKLAIGYVNKGLTLTRPEVGTSEPGSGSTSLSSQGAMAAFKYGMAIGNNTLVSPYAGLRYVKSMMGGYTEAQTAKVAFPLSYDAINNYVTTAIAGVTGQRRLNEKTSVFASAGIEKDLNTNISNLVTSGNGYFNIAMNGNYQNTRANASLGANYFISPKERLSLVGIYRQEAYQAISSTTVMATYTVGL